ncbi:MAG TPA: Yip1 family protein [Ktedonosporobacter sp.]|nr:Yip1 family protein [Ktedonosporobacter sp.]
MYPSPDQEAEQNVSPAYANPGASPYTAQGLGENTPSAYDHAQYSAYNTPTPAAYPALTSERRGLLLDVVAYPWQSVCSLCLPGVRTFARATLSARWAVFWISLFALPVFSSLLAILLGGAGHHLTAGMLTGIVLGPLIVIPILFFIIQGMMWPLARHYQGGGTFLEQCHTTFLPLGPFFLLGSTATLLLSIDSTSVAGALLMLITLALFLYSSVLLVVSLKAVHGLTTWEAITLAILPIFSILAVLVLIIVVFFMLSNNDNNSSSSGNSSKGNSNQNNSAGNTAGGATNQRTGRYYRDSYWWWWWGNPGYRKGNPRRNQQYVSSSAHQNQQYVGRSAHQNQLYAANQNPKLKFLWFCPTCQYRRWLRWGPEQVACARCSAPMQVTEATR